MHLHHSKKVSLYTLSRELEKIAQFSYLTNNAQERQALASHAWIVTGGLERDQKTPESARVFNEFLRIFTRQDSTIRHRLCPSTYNRSTTPQVLSQGGYWLGLAGIDLQSIDHSIRENLCDFICAVSHYHDSLYLRPNTPSGSTSFSDLILQKTPDLQKSLLHHELDESVNAFTHHLMSSYLSGFDLDKITFGKSRDYGNVIYGDANACAVLKSLQSTLKFDLKSLGVDTSFYQEALDVADICQKNATSMLSDKGPFNKIASRIRRKNRSGQKNSTFDHSSPN